MRLEKKNTKPIYCVDLNIYFKDRFICENYFLSNGFDKFDGRSLYNKINKKIKYKGYMFEYITKKEFNDKKKEYDDGISNFVVYGDYYKERYVK